MKTQILLLLGAALITAACSSTTPKHSNALENTTGGYLAPAGSQWYRAEGGSLYAYDGEAWYVLRSPENNAGYIGGANVGAPERWVKFGQGENQNYARTPATFRNQTLQPVFLPY